MSVRDLLPMPTETPAANDAVPVPFEDEEEILAAAGRLIRGGFIMPSADFALLAALKARAAATGALPDSSELLRAGLHALMQSGRSELRRLLDGLAPCTPRRRRGKRLRAPAQPDASDR